MAAESLSQQLSRYGEDQLSHYYSLRGAEEQPTLEFWKTNLVKYCLENKKLHFSVDEIMSAFTVDDLVPGFFGQSAIELLKNKLLFDKGDILKSDDSDLLTYLMSSLWSSVFDNNVDISKKLLICGEILKNLEICIAKHANSLHVKDLAFSRCPIPDFAHNFQSFLEAATAQIQDPTERQLWTAWVKSLPQDDVDTIISHFVKQKFIKADEKVVNILVKSKNEKDIQTATAYLDIRITLHDISKKLNGLQEKIHQHTQNAIKAKARSDTTSALMFLKLKKNSEASLQRILQAQYNLEECLQTMEGNEINKIVVEAYSSASKALKSVRKESGVTIDSVESAMEMFQDEMDQMQEISDALVSSSVASISEEEKDALQEELDAILREENVSSSTGTTQANISTTLPTAPTTNINISTPILDTDLKKAEKVAVIN